MADQSRDDLPPSAKFILTLIEDEEPIDRSEIVAEVAPIYQEDTVDDALKHLREGGFAECSTCPKDNRKRIYKIKSND